MTTAPSGNNKKARRAPQQRRGRNPQARNDNLQVFAAPVVLRPPSRHRPRRPPKTATGVSRSHKGRAANTKSNLDLAYRQRPSTAGGLGGGSFGKSSLLQITPMFKDARSRAAMGDSVFNFREQADADGDVAKMAAENPVRGRRRRKSGRTSAARSGNNGRRGRAAGSSMSGFGGAVQPSPRLARNQIGQTGMSQQIGSSRGAVMVPSVPDDAKGRSGSAGVRHPGGVSPRVQRISKVR